MFLPTAQPDRGTDPELSPNDATPRPRITPTVLEVRGHDRDSFTQGLQFVDGRLFESRGQRGQSALTEIDANTGDVLRSVRLADNLFGEGLAVVGDRLIQLTWQAGLALVYDMDSFELVDTLTYEGEGWGLCHHDNSLVMSDGSATLTYRDPATFEVRATVEVTLAGTPIDRLNELECVDDRVYANVWQQDVIVVIDSAGLVETVIDAAALRDLVAEPGAEVLNGIAYDDATGTFLLTGKYWPTMYEVRLD